MKTVACVVLLATVLALCEGYAPKRPVFYNAASTSTTGPKPSSWDQYSYGTTSSTSGGNSYVASFTTTAPYMYQTTTYYSYYTSTTSGYSYSYSGTTYPSPVYSYGTTSSTSGGYSYVASYTTTANNGMSTYTSTYFSTTSGSSYFSSFSGTTTSQPIVITSVPSTTTYNARMAAPQQDDVSMFGQLRSKFAKMIFGVDDVAGDAPRSNSYTYTSTTSGWVYPPLSGTTGVSSSSYSTTVSGYGTLTTTTGDYFNSGSFYATTYANAKSQGVKVEGAKVDTKAYKPQQPVLRYGNARLNVIKDE